MADEDESMSAGGGSTQEVNNVVESPSPSNLPAISRRGLGALLSQLRTSDNAKSHSGEKTSPTKVFELLKESDSVPEPSAQLTSDTVKLEATPATSQMLQTMDVGNENTLNNEGSADQSMPEVPSLKRKASPTSALHSDEQVDSKKERRVASGMAAILQQLRSTSDKAQTDDVKDTKSSDEVASVSVDSGTVAEDELIDVDLSKLNRKERRALLMKKRQLEGRSYETQQPDEAEQASTSAPIPELPPTEYSFGEDKPLLEFRETTAFSGEVPRFGFAESMFSNNYIKLSKFSPCGRYVATTSQDRNARIFSIAENDNVLLCLLSTIGLGDVPYDAVWHPCGDLLATSSRLHPIHLWSTDGQRVASYRGINHLDELSAAQTMTFSTDGLTMYAGYNKFIRVWDVRRPGKQLYEIKTFKTQPYKLGQKAIISSIAVNPEKPSMYVAATYGPTLGVYSDSSDFSEYLFGGNISAITHIKFSSDGHRLYGSERKTGRIYCWDMRNMGKVVFTMERTFNTNQKIYFDVDKHDRYLFCGTSDGKVAVFDLKEGESLRKPIHVKKIANCSIPCVSLHSSLPILAACTGERIFPMVDLDGDLEEFDRTSYLETRSKGDLQNELQILRY